MEYKKLIMLLQLCRNELQITWQNRETDERILNHIRNGVRHISDIGGVTDDDFLEGGRANALLLAYVRRAVSGDISTFENDYMSELLGLQIESEVNSYGEKQAESV